jgi:hypothetical protein
MCYYNPCHANAVMVIEREDADKGFWTIGNNIWPTMYTRGNKNWPPCIFK